ncbi:hypothetical protein EB796_009978 [Bugula neritina]|uniref:Uncharacterized protein n=1 Tax=Bugula neritina TaxID=10212 RepID=A0A7J7K155_BUGNE|nr:hypothetical protein EB796_009978 [Bugula neritina]
MVTFQLYVLLLSVFLSLVTKLRPINTQNLYFNFKTYSLVCLKLFSLFIFTWKVVVCASKCFHCVHLSIYCYDYALKYFLLGYNLQCILFETMKMQHIQCIVL